MTSEEQSVEAHPPEAPAGAEGGEEPGSPAASMRGRLKECARSDGTLAERRGRLKQASERFRAFARRFRRRP